MSEKTQARAIAYAVVDEFICAASGFKRAWEEYDQDSKKATINCLEIIIGKYIQEQSPLPAPLFTRTVYSEDALCAQINSLETLGFKNYVIERDVEERTKRDIFANKDVSDNRDRWIIKVYGEATE